MKKSSKILQATLSEGRVGGEMDFSLCSKGRIVEMTGSGHFEGIREIYVCENIYSNTKTIGQWSDQIIFVGCETLGTFGKMSGEIRK